MFIKNVYDHYIDTKFLLYDCGLGPHVYTDFFFIKIPSNFDINDMECFYSKLQK